MLTPLGKTVELIDLHGFKFDIKDGVITAYYNIIGEGSALSDDIKTMFADMGINNYSIKMWPAGKTVEVRING